MTKRQLQLTRFDAGGEASRLFDDEDFDDVIDCEYGAWTLRHMMSPNGAKLTRLVSLKD